MNPQPVSLADELRKLRERLDEQAQEWDEKNDDSPMPTSAKSPDYVYGYNSGVSQGFTSAAAKLSALLAQHAVAEPPQSAEITPAEFSFCMEGYDSGAVRRETVLQRLNDRLKFPAHAAEQPKLTWQALRDACESQEAQNLLTADDEAYYGTILTNLLTSPVEKENPDAS